MAAEIGLSGESKSENAAVSPSGAARHAASKAGDVRGVVDALERRERAFGVGRAQQRDAFRAQRLDRGLEPVRVLGVVRARVVLEKDGIVEDRDAAHGASLPQVWATIAR